MLGVHLQIDRATAPLPGDLQGSPKQLATHATTPTLGNDEQLVEPGHQSPVLQGPREGQDRHADRRGIVGEEDGPSRGVGKQAQNADDSRCRPRSMACSRNCSARRVTTAFTSVAWANWMRIRHGTRATGLRYG
jgi:hypothetical protein